MIQGYLQRKTIRNLYFIRYQTVSVLAMTFRSMRSFDFKEWLENSAPMLLQSFNSCDFENGTRMSHESQDDPFMDNYLMLLNMCMSAYEQARTKGDDEMRIYCDAMSKGIPTPSHISEDLSPHELQGEWDMEDFILSGGLMLTLCTLEEFERGLLRILSLYGVQPQVEDSSRKPVHPSLRDLSKSSPEWEEAENSKSVYSVSGRHAILESYSINAEPDMAWNDRLWSIRTDRNTLARSVATLRYPFQTFLQVHYDAYRAIRHLANEAMASQRIAL